MSAVHLPRGGLPLVTPGFHPLRRLHLDGRVYANRSTGKGRKKWPVFNGRLESPLRKRNLDLNLSSRKYLETGCFIYEKYIFTIARGVHPVLRLSAAMRGRPV